MDEDGSRRPRVGLVLGAGGVVGQAYHAGVLAALEHDLGWDPRGADIIVGSSAGSITGTLLRIGVPASDLAAWAVEAPLSSEEGQSLAKVLGDDLPAFPGPSLRDALRRWQLPSPALIGRTLRRPWAFRPAVAAMTLLPIGQVDLASHVASLEEVAGEEWPDDLWICAARRSDGGRVVFGRPGSPRASLHQAVAASCAIPSYFQPVTIEGIRYFDGGVHSPTNADVLRHEDLDVVVVVSPMSSARGRIRSADGLLRLAFHRRLAGEVRKLRRSGIRVVTFEPASGSVPALGLNAMAADRADRVVQEAFLETGRWAARPDVAEVLAPLATRPGRASTA
ncbi:MAG TPA: patatin-like phospholipase family protein [Acidimicrobiales bacterium]|nr:patatin-like phospholipase family protein [Acidimicrobiales bacterium]